MNRQEFADLVGDVLGRAREILSDPARWTQGEFARDAQGRAMSAGQASACDEATCFCLIGAIRRAAWGLGRDGRLYGCCAARECISRCLSSRGETTHIANFNDNASHAEVLSVLEGARAHIRDVAAGYYA